VALEEAVQLRRFKKFLKEYGGRGEFANMSEIYVFDTSVLINFMRTQRPRLRRFV
jgi:hypothetical protein